MGRLIQRLDRGAVAIARRVGVSALRASLGVVFVWFGALKVADMSPVADLVAEMIPFVADRAAVVVLGVLEILVGLGLLSGWMIRLTLGVFFAQMLGTFLILLVEPSRSFEGANPFRLTVLGEFVIKNLVLLTAGIVVAAATIPRARGEEGLGEMLARRADSASDIPPPRGTDDR